jgi:hypothetical protein
MMKTNPYIDRVLSNLDEETLRTSFTTTVEPIENLEFFPVDTGKRLLQEHLTRIYVPNTQGIALAQRILETGLAHALELYPDMATYISTSQSDRMCVKTDPHTWMVTGLAGIGKSATIRALQKLLDKFPIFQASEHCPPRPVLGGIILTVVGRVRNAEILNILAQKLAIKDRCQDKVKSSLVDTIRLEMYRQGCMFLVVDESQTIANGKQAGASYVNFVVFLQNFGIPVVVVGNYSMGHGILAQHSQNRQRLVVDPYIMAPDSADDIDYVQHLTAYARACGPVLNIDPHKDTAAINWLTGGCSRALLNLICIGYKLLRQANPKQAKVVVDLAALESTYADQAYSVFREEIELLRTHLLTGKRIRSDLMCPFTLSGTFAEQGKKVVDQWRRHAVARGILESSYTPKEKAQISSGQLAEPEFVSPSIVDVKMPGSSSVKIKGAISKLPQQAPIKAVKRPRKPPPSVGDAVRSWGASA